MMILRYVLVRVRSHVYVYIYTTVPTSKPIEHDFYIQSIIQCCLCYVFCTIQIIGFVFVTVIFTNSLILVFYSII